MISLVKTLNPAVLVSPSFTFLSNRFLNVSVISIGGSVRQSVRRSVAAVQKPRFLADFVHGEILNINSPIYGNTYGQTDEATEY